MKEPVNSIIFVNGTSSAGKSTLCNALKNQLDKPFWHFSSDHFIESGMHPKNRFDQGEFSWAEHRPHFFEAFHRSIAAFSHAGINLLVDHIVEEPEWVPEIATRLQHSDVFVVSVTCPLAELTRREQERGDRRAGEAAYHQKTYAFTPADIEIDTTQPLHLNCETILTAWRARSLPSTFTSQWVTV